MQPGEPGNDRESGSKAARRVVSGVARVFASGSL